MELSTPGESGENKQNRIKIEMDGKVDPQEIRDLFNSTGWNEEAALSDDKINTAFNEAYCNFLARESQGKLIGIVRASYDGMYVMLWNLVVHPSYRNQGIGSNLVEKILTEMKSRGHESIVGLAVNTMVQTYTNLGLKPTDHLTVVTTNPKL